MSEGFEPSLVVCGQHPPGDPAQHLADNLALARRSARLNGVVKGSHFSACSFQSV